MVFRPGYRLDKGVFTHHTNALFLHPSTNHRNPGPGLDTVGQKVSHMYWVMQRSMSLPFRVLGCWFGLFFSFFSFFYICKKIAIPDEFLISG